MVKYGDWSYPRVTTLTDSSVRPLPCGTHYTGLQVWDLNEDLRSLLLIICFAERIKSKSVKGWLMKIWSAFCSSSFGMLAEIMPAFHSSQQHWLSHTGTCSAVPGCRCWREQFNTATERECALLPQKFINETKYKMIRSTSCVKITSSLGWTARLRAGLESWWSELFNWCKWDGRSYHCCGSCSECCHALSVPSPSRMFPILALTQGPALGVSLLSVRPEGSDFGENLSDQRSLVHRIYEQCVHACYKALLSLSQPVLVNIINSTGTLYMKWSHIIP